MLDISVFQPIVEVSHLRGSVEGFGHPQKWKERLYVDIRVLFCCTGFVMASLFGVLNPVNYNLYTLGWGCSHPKNIIKTDS